MDKILNLSGGEFFTDPDFRLSVVPTNSEHRDRDWVNYTYVPHRHDFAEMVLVSGGAGIQNIDGIDYPVRAGDLFLLDGECEHFFRKTGDFLLLNLLFDRATLKLPWSRFQRCDGYNWFFIVEPRLRSPRAFRNRLHLTVTQQKTLETMLEEIRSHLRRNHPGDDMRALASLVNVILYVAACCEARDTVTEEMPPRISATMAWLEKHFAEAHTLEDLARRACMSPRNFTRCFRRGTGMSPIAFLRHVRLRQAAALLKNSSADIVEIAQQCGYADSNYFTKLFAQHYGVPPAAFRRRGGAPTNDWLGPRRA